MVMIINLAKILAVAIVILAVFIIVKMIKKRMWQNRNRRRLMIIASQSEDIKTFASENKNLKTDKILAYASQILGTRNEQQDSFYVSDNAVEFDLLEDSYIAVSVCDGMGGLASGEVASKIAVDCIKNQFEQYFMQQKEKNVPEFLRKIAIEANNLVYQYSIEECQGQMCGTTMVMTLLKNNYLYWLSVGDSRIYIIRDNQIVQLTNDHNYTYVLKERVKNGEITEEEALAEENREALISYIGMPELDLIDLSRTPIKLIKEDIVLLCSDGLTKVMTNEEICDYVSRNKNNIESLAKSLPLTSFDRNEGSQDNTTVAVICYR